MLLSSFSRRALALLVALLALVSSAAAANVSTTAELVQPNAIPLPLWLTIFGVALILLNEMVLVIVLERPDSSTSTVVD